MAINLSNIKGWKGLNKSLIAKLSAICLFCTLIGASVGFVVAQSSSSYMTITTGQYPGAPAYSIFEGGGVFYLKNNYGEIEYSSANASEVGNLALDSVEDRGTVEFLDDIVLTSPLLIMHTVNLIAQKITLSGSDGIIIGDETHNVQNYNIRVNEINGVDQSTIGITINNGVFGRITFNKISECDAAFLFDSVVDPFQYPNGAGENTIMGGIIGDYDTEGIHGNTAIRFSNSTGWMEGNRFLAVGIYSHDIGIDFGYGDSAYTYFIGFLDLVGAVAPVSFNWGNSFGHTINTYFTMPVVYNVPDSTIFVNPYGPSYNTLPVYQNDTAITLYPVKSNQSIPIGTGTTWGDGVYFYFQSGSSPSAEGCGIVQGVHYNAGGTFQDGETLTIGFHYRLMDDTWNEIFKTFTATDSGWLDIEDFWELTTDREPIKSMWIDASTDRGGATSLTLYGSMLGVTV